jgi:hypothetical protein
MREGARSLWAALGLVHAGPLRVGRARITYSGDRRAVIFLQRTLFGDDALADARLKGHMEDGGVFREGAPVRILAALAPVVKAMLSSRPSNPNGQFPWRPETSSSAAASLVLTPTLRSPKPPAGSDPPEARHSNLFQEHIMTPVTSKPPLRPYLVSKDEEGIFRVTVRTTRFNSQGYPLVSSETLEDAFNTQTAARTFVREQFRAETGQIATK